MLRINLSEASKNYEMGVAARFFRPQQVATAQSGFKANSSQSIIYFFFLRIPDTTLLYIPGKYYD